MPFVTFSREAKEVVVVTENHGGFKGGHCIACKAGGWLAGIYGYPSHVKALATHLKHTPECPMNAVLNDDGTLKE